MIGTRSPGCSGNRRTRRRRRRRRPGTLEPQREALLSWIQEEIPATRMLELARQDPRAALRRGCLDLLPLRGPPARGARGGRRAGDPLRGAAGRIRAVGLGRSSRARSGARPVKRVFLAGRLKYSRVGAVRWRTQMDLETLLRAMLEIVEGWGGVPWAWVFDNMKTVTLGRDAAGHPRWNPAFWRFATEVGCHPELCDPGAAQQKGTVENLVKWVKTNFLPGRSFADDEDLARQSLAWEQDKAVAALAGPRPAPDRSAAAGARGLRAADDDRRRPMACIGWRR